MCFYWKIEIDTEWDEKIIEKTNTKGKEITPMGAKGHTNVSNPSKLKQYVVLVFKKSAEFTNLN